jgi:predicted acylesterase/phospholipase RssA
MAAQIAMGWTPEKMVTENRRIWFAIRPHKDYTLPLLSLMDNGKGLRCGEQVYGSARIEDLWVPFFCVSSDLSHAAMCVHRTGSLLVAATASASLPGVFPPILQDEHLLVDGAVFDNLPGDIVRELGCGELIASRVSVEADQSFLYERVPTVREILRRYVTPWRAPIRYPSLVEVALRAAMLASINRENAVSRDADFLFQPPLERFGMMEFTALDAIVDAGYRHAMTRITDWQRSGRLARIVPAPTPLPAVANPPL